MRKLIVIIITCIMLSVIVSCRGGLNNLNGAYIISWGDFFDNGYVGHTITGVLDSEQRIENVKNAKWNYKIMIAEQDIEDPKRWFAIVAKGDSLVGVSTRDTLIGPLFQKQIDSILIANNIKDLEEKVFVK